MVPNKNAYAYFDDIVKQHTRYVPDKGYKVVDRKAIRKAITGIVKDEKLSQQYRYELYLYAKSMGYITDN